MSLLQENSERSLVMSEAAKSAEAEKAAPAMEVEEVSIQDYKKVGFFLYRVVVFQENEEDEVMKEVSKMSTDEIVARTRLLDNDIRIMKSEVVRISHEKQAQEDKIKENTEKIKVQFHTSALVWSTTTRL